MEDLFERSFRIGDHVIDVLAETSVQGRTLHLKEISIYPREAMRVPLGTRKVLNLRDQLIEEIRTLGFERLHISGTRLSGAKEQKKVSLWIDLKQ